MNCISISWTVWAGVTRECDRQTDRQTDGQTDNECHASLRCAARKTTKRLAWLQKSYSAVFSFHIIYVGPWQHWYSSSVTHYCCAAYITHYWLVACISGISLWIIPRYLMKTVKMPNAGVICFVLFAAATLFVVCYTNHCYMKFMSLSCGSIRARFTVSMHERSRIGRIIAEASTNHAFTQQH